MPRPCKACSSPNEKAINQRLRSGTTLLDVARYLDSIGDPIGRNALSRHLPHVGLGPRTSGPRPISTDLLEAVRDRAHERLAAGEIEPGIKDGIAAQKALDDRLKVRLGEEWQYKLIQALTGHVGPVVRVIDPERIEQESEYRELLEAGQ